MPHSTSPVGPDIQEDGYGLPRIPLPRTPVNSPMLLPGPVSRSTRLAPQSRPTRPCSGCRPRPVAFEQPRALRNGRSPSSTRLVAQTAVSALLQAAGVETIEAVLSIHTPGVPEVRMTRETPARAECDSLHVSPSGITFSRKVKLQPEARDSHRVCAGAFVHSINAFGVGCVRLVVWGV